MKARRLSLCAFLASIAVLALLVLTRARSTAAQTAPITGPANTTAPAATTPDAENVELVGHIGGPTRGVFVEGHYAYIGEGPRLTILDISSPTSPTVVGKTLPLPGIVRDVYVSGSYAYVAADEAGLRVVDVSDPAAPAEFSSCDTPQEAKGVVVAGHYAYVADEWSGLWIVDISNPATPHAVSHYEPSSWRVNDVAVAGDPSTGSGPVYAYVAGNSGYGPRYDGELWVVDVSNPLIPLEVGFCDTPGQAKGVVVSGGYAYVADGGRGLQVLDVFTPSNPACVVGSAGTPGYANGVTVAGNYAYVADGPDGWASYYGNSLQVVDISIPITPTRVGSIDKPGGAQSVAAAGTCAYIANGGRGLWTVDVTAPSDPVDAGSYDLLGYARDVEVAESYVYVADYGSGLRVVDVSDPAAPARAGFCDTPGHANGVAVEGSMAYVTDGSLQVVYVADPEAPVPLGSCDTPSAGGVAVTGTYAHVAGGDLWLIDVTYPTIPKKASSCETPDRAYDVALEGAYAYVADDLSGLRVMDVSTPANPRCEVGFYDTPGFAYGVAVAGNYAYVAAWGSGLRVVDISTPTSPTEVGSCDTPGDAYKVAVAGGYAYVADRDGGLRVVDVSTPISPTEVGFYDTPGDAYGVTVAGDPSTGSGPVYAYVADNDGGLFILRYTAEPPPTLYPISNPDGDGDYLVDWSDVAGALTYTLQEDDNAGFASPTTRYTGSVSQVAISGQAAGTWYYRVKAASSSGESGWSNVEFTSVGDAYEPDDTCAQANALATNGTAQHHTFHQHADEDWAHFTAVSGTTYVVQAVHTGTGADLVLELHDACDQPPLSPDDEDTFGNDAHLIFTAPSSGTYYVKALNHDPAVYGPLVSYELSMRTRSPVPIVVIVAGRNEADQLEDNITFMGDQAYRTFRRAGVPRENIRYLSVGVDRDADQDGHPDVDGAPSRGNMRHAVWDWPQARGLQPGKPFYLYLADHGGTDYFCAEGCEVGKRVSAIDLDLWLGELEAATGADEVNVIVEACYSGSFVDVTAYGPAEVSSPGRVVIASTGSRRRAFPSQRGAYFSDAFFTALGDNADLWTAYVAGRTATRAAWREQTPWLDDNGDAVADASDGQVARQRGLVAFGGGSIPVVDWLQVGEVSESGVATIMAQVRDDVAVMAVTVEIYPPGFRPRDTGEGETPVLEIDRVVLRDADGDGVYEGEYMGFTEEGIYRLVAHAWDDDENLSLPRRATVGEQKTYLPMMVRDAEMQ